MEPIVSKPLPFRASFDSTPAAEEREPVAHRLRRLGQELNFHRMRHPVDDELAAPYHNVLDRLHEAEQAEAGVKS
jgi:hypothetical protein